MRHYGNGLAGRKPMTLKRADGLMLERSAERADRVLPSIDWAARETRPVSSRHRFWCSGPST